LGASVWPHGSIFSDTKELSIMVYLVLVVVIGRLTPRVVFSYLAHGYNWV